MALHGVRVAWIGVGRMGEPMSRRLLQAGARLTVHDRDPAPVAPLLARGATAAASVAEAVREAEVSFSTVPDDLALEEVAAGIAAAARPDLLHVDMSTVSPAVSARVAATLAAAGTAYLRCPVSGSTATAAAGQLALFVSGPDVALARAAPMLDVLATRRMQVGPAEEARAMKLLVNTVVAAMPALLGEALAFGSRMGLKRDVMVDALGQSVVASPLLGYKAAAMKARDWTPAASIDLLSKDLDLALSAAHDAGLTPVLTEQVRAAYSARQRAGEGALDFFRLTDAD